MNWVDGAIVVLMLVGGWRGAARGLGQTGCQVAGAVGGVVAAYVFGERAAAELARRLLLPDWLARPLAVVALALGLTLVGQLVGRGWNRWVKGSALEAWDRWAGGALGLTLALIACGVLLFVWIEWPGRAFPEAVEQSYLARRLLEALPAFYRKVDWVLAPMR